MKKNILTLIVAVLCGSLSAQVIHIQDKSLRAHNERMVHKSWGEFRPYPKYFLGVQTNPNYGLVWGLFAPRRNKRYKNGEDIRPLKPTGLQNQRYISAHNSYLYAKQVKEKSDVVGNEAVEELMYYDKTTAKADPIYILYFREVLKPISEYNKLNPYYDKKVSFQVASILRKTGIEEKVVEEMELLKDRLSTAFNNDMERGQRLIFYHRILDDFRSFDASLNHKIYISTVYQSFKSNNTNTEPYDIDYSKFKDMNDYKIMKDIIHKINRKF
ncbi:MAG: hypothetical protein Q4G63_04385 [Bacteroidia bacterium]|nr:hypothetical protein [Bacteroidia bacterium]